MTESEVTETPSATFGNVCTRTLYYKAPVNKMEISQEYDHLLDGARSCAGSKPLSMDAEWTQRRGII